MKTIALTMIVKNEERCLRRCLESVKDVVNEMIIVDTGSTDRTKSIANEFHAKVYDYDWIDSFADARNFAIEKSTSDFNLIIDADEFLHDNASTQIATFIKNNNGLGRVSIRNVYKDQSGEIKVATERVTRILPKGVYFKGAIHEQVDSDLPRVDTAIVFNHDGYLEKNKTERNLPLLLKELEKAPEDSYVLFQVGKQYRLMGDYKEAISYYEKSYNKSDKGFFYSINLVIDLLYCYINSTCDEKGLKIIDQQKVFLNGSPDFHFACGLFYLNLILGDIPRYGHLLPTIEASYLSAIHLGNQKAKEIVEGTSSYLALYNLGTYYESFGMKEKAVLCYKEASLLGYDKANERLLTI